MLRKYKGGVNLHHCEICGSKADIHHIVHKHEGGYDIKLNYKYLCNYHHRGKVGPHNCAETDLKYKLELQEKLFGLLPKDYYTAKELYKILEISKANLKRLIKELKLFKEGYSKIDVIKRLMGGELYSQDMLEELELERLYHNINIS
jgi:recombinational DNA repair protein (RecF pathway)